MKRVFIYWKTKDREREAQLKAALGIKEVSVNGESEYNGDLERLVPYVEEGLITIRTKEYEERRVKEVRFYSKQSQPYNCKKIRRGSGKRKV